MLEYYLAHQEDVVTRRTKYDLNKAKERAHILEGLLIALDNIDEIIKIIRGSANVNIAKEELIKRFGLSDVQAQAIVDMRLRALTGLERERLEAEYNELLSKIEYFEGILADNKKLLGVIKEEILIVEGKYKDDRRTGFIQDDEMEDEDLIQKEDIIIAMTKLGYIKRMSPDNFNVQNRGGKGIKGMQTIDDDFIEDIVMSTTHKDIYFFTNKGRVYTIKGYKIPEASRTARGIAIVNLLQLQPDEKISAIIPSEASSGEGYLFMVTKKGTIKKCRINLFDNIRKNGLAAINLTEDDELIEVKVTHGDDDLIIVSKYGMCIRINDKDIRAMGRGATGVRGMRLNEADEVIGMQLASQGEYLLLVSEYGYGKRTKISEFKVQNRGGKGIICYKDNDKTGKLVGAKLVNEDREILLITTEGIIIRIEVSGISVLGRAATGVKLMNIDRESDTKIASIAKVREEKNTESVEESNT